MRRTLLLLALAAAPLAAQSAPSPAEQSRLDGGIAPFVQADVAFMQGMIGHHAQAVRMAGWAKTNGARADVIRLSERIAVAQTDEIDFMRNWLRVRKQEVPDPAHAHHHAHMPGMLTDAELAQLQAARGSDFDRLFLTLMIRHHEGAILMVEQLFASPGAANDDDVFKFASDVSVDQHTEVERMWTMLATVPAPKQP